jgi:hypothetical protein
MDLKEVLPVCSHYFFIWCLPTNKVVQLIRFNHHKLVRNSLFLSWNILFSWLEHVLLAIQSPRDICKNECIKDRYERWLSGDIFVLPGSVFI